jgi:hypothetical protein
MTLRRSLLDGEIRILTFLEQKSSNDCWLARTVETVCRNSTDRGDDGGPNRSSAEIGGRLRWDGAKPVMATGPPRSVTL